MCLYCHGKMAAELELVDRGGDPYLRGVWRGWGDVESLDSCGKRATR